MFKALKVSQHRISTSGHGASDARPTKNIRPAAGRKILFTAAFLLALALDQAIAQASPQLRFKFENVADSTQGFSSFSTFPSINNASAVAFQATSTSLGQGVFKWQEGKLTSIASNADGFSLFGIDPAINAEGVVAFDANISATDRQILTSAGDGTPATVIVDSKNQGLIRPFLGSPAINRFGTVVFRGVRIGFSQAIFTGNGGALTTVIDTADPTSNFTGFQDTAINASGSVVFVGDRPDGTEGIFVAAREREAAGAGGPATLLDIVDTNNPDFAGFGDPVINRFGTIADAAFRSDGGVEVLSGNRQGITARTNVAQNIFLNLEHPSINDENAVAFKADKIAGGHGIFIEVTGGASPVPVIQTGDTLFGSTVTEIDLGRFALNDRFQMAIQYALADGRSGVAIASLQGEREDRDR